jgi:antitoxin component YwqK of YwqJK toxin-antitoxin module
MDGEHQKERATYMDGNINGISLRFYPSGSVSEKINVYDGLIEGLYEAFFENGRIKKRSSYQNDREEGLSIEYYDSEGSPKLRETQYENGKKDGMSQEYDEKEELLSRTVYENDKTVSIKKYEDGEIVVREQYKDGVLFEREMFKNGDVVSSEIYEDGVLLERMIYDDGEIVLFESYVEGNIEHRERFVDGKLNGICEEFYPRGENPIDQIAIRANYVDDKKDGLEERFYENGAIRIRSMYQNGLLNGVSESFLRNGRHLQRTNYLNGERSGIDEEFYNNDRNSVMSRAEVSHGVLHGLSVTYDVDGGIESETMYEHGNPVSVISLQQRQEMAKALRERKPKTREEILNDIKEQEEKRDDNNLCKNDSDMFLSPISSEMEDVMFLHVGNVIYCYGEDEINLLKQNPVKNGYGILIPVKDADEKYINIPLVKLPHIEKFVIADIPYVRHAKLVIEPYNVGDNYRSNVYRIVPYRF